MATRAEIQQEITSIENALQVLRRSLAVAQPGSSGQTQLSIQIFDLEKRLAALYQQLRATPGTTATPVRPPSTTQLPRPPAVTTVPNETAAPAPVPAAPAAPAATQEVATSAPAAVNPDFVFDPVTGEQLPANSVAANEAIEANAAAADAAAATAAKARAQQQKTLSTRRDLGNNSDWRFKIKLAPGANYLYAGETPGILAPLKDRGVIFPYTPQIDTQYVANYDRYDLIHSNYRGYFYKNSAVNELTVTGLFTAQDTVEAQYLLAVIHFFRSVTKMFYGNDPQAGTPPPLVYISGFGPYQFNEHACLVSNFTYSLPSDVDYIRADAPNQIGVNLENRNSRSSGIGQTGPFAAMANRLRNANLFTGAVPRPPEQSVLQQNVNTPTASNATYVPTKMQITVQLLPVQTRSQVSKQFSLEGFANGRLLKGGFW